MKPNTKGLVSLGKPMQGDVKENLKYMLKILKEQSS
jgi:hypothetical protein